MKKFDKCWLPELSTKVSTVAFEMITVAGSSDSSDGSDGSSVIIETIKREILGTYEEIFAPLIRDFYFSLTAADRTLTKDAYRIFELDAKVTIAASTDTGLLYGLFHFYRLVQEGVDLENLDIRETPKNGVRMIHNWDNVDIYPFPTGAIERGYSGGSIFYQDKKVVSDKTRLLAYARLLASVGINQVIINNNNVIGIERYLITDRYLPQVKELTDLFATYGIKILTSIDFASPMTIAGLPSSDPLLPEVQNWWNQTVAHIYEVIPDFGGFLVKADSEGRPGPFAYNRTVADGANMIARALAPFGGLVFWRTFVYNTQNDWHDRKADRAKNAFDYFKPQDGDYLDNVVLQSKNGPMDFQVREPVCPLFGGMTQTNIAAELQITQEYTGQQIHLCYLIAQWKEVLDFDTFANGQGSTVAKILENQTHSAMVGISNVGDDYNWTGHKLAQANLYGFCRLAWNPELSAESITDEWIAATFGRNPQVKKVIRDMLLSSWQTYENYTTPLGAGWFVDVETHFKCDIDSHEYGPWGTCHYADREGIGMYRTRDMSGFVDQYYQENADRYNNLTTCPDELLLFFHHVPYTHVLHSGKTVIQHIYDSHFAGAARVKQYLADWQSLRGLVDEISYENVENRLTQQLAEAENWRDTVNAYFYRKSGIPDAFGRKIY